MDSLVVSKSEMESFENHELEVSMGQNIQKYKNRISNHKIEIKKAMNLTNIEEEQFETNKNNEKVKIFPKIEKLNFQKKIPFIDNQNQGTKTKNMLNSCKNLSSTREYNIISNQANQNTFKRETSGTNFIFAMSNHIEKILIKNKKN